MALIIAFTLFLRIGFFVSYSGEFNDNLLNRIQAVEDREQTQSLRLHSLEKQVKDYDEKYKFLQKENAILKRDLGATTTKVRSMEMMIAHLNHKNEDLKHNAEKEHAFIVDHKEVVMQLYTTPETVSININTDVHVPSERRRPITNTWVGNKTDSHKEFSNLQASSNIMHGAVSFGQTNITSNIMPAESSAQTYSQKSHAKRMSGASRESRQQSDVVAFHTVLTPYNVPMGATADDAISETHMPQKIVVTFGCRLHHCLDISMAVIYIVILILNIEFCACCSEGINDDLWKRIEALENREREYTTRIQHLENQVNGNNAKYEILQEENNILKRDQAETNKKLNDMENVIIDLNQDMSNMKYNTEKNQIQVDALKEMVIQLQSTQKELVNIHTYNDVPDEQRNPIPLTLKNAEYHKQLHHLEADTSLTQDTVPIELYSNQSNIPDAKSLAHSKSSRIKRKTIAGIEKRQRTDKVAFHAVMTTRHVDNLGTDETIIFNNVLLNAGNGYHTPHGLFIAPQSGIYLFSVTLANVQNSYFWAYMVKNGATLASVITDAPHINQGSVSVLAQLSVGDEVWVKHTSPAGGSIWGSGTLPSVVFYL
ncbi:positive regulation of adiponectin secretion [Mactra antiquata]